MASRMGTFRNAVWGTPRAPFGQRVGVKRAPLSGLTGCLHPIVWRDNHTTTRKSPLARPTSRIEAIQNRASGVQTEPASVQNAFHFAVFPLRGMRDLHGYVPDNNNTAGQ